MFSSHLDGSDSHYYCRLLESRHTYEIVNHANKTTDSVKRQQPVRLNRKLLGVLQTSSLLLYWNVETDSNYYCKLLERIHVDEIVNRADKSADFAKR